MRSVFVHIDADFTIFIHQIPENHIWKITGSLERSQKNTIIDTRKNKTFSEIYKEF